LLAWVGPVPIFHASFHFLRGLHASQTRGTVVVVMSDHLQVWEEPVRGGYPDASALTLSGLERMRAWVKGQIQEPPVCRLIGMRVVEAGVGTCTYVTSASE